LTAFDGSCRFLKVVVKGNGGVAQITVAPYQVRPGRVAVYHHSVARLSLSEHAVGVIWTIIIGFIAGVLAKFIMPGKNEPSGFVLTTILGIVGAFVASYIGQALGWYSPGEGAGLIGAVVGAIIVLFVWGAIAKRRA